jgi:hypothetical protein
MSDTFRVETNGLEIAARLAKISDGVLPRARAVTRHFGQLLVTTIQRNASLPRSGPPGPRLQTGDYVRSWNLRMQGNASFARATAGTNRPQARRLEFGFTGVDAIGRRYRQPPYPHAGPALDEIAPQFVAAVKAIPAQADGPILEGD